MELWMEFVFNSSTLYLGAGVGESPRSFLCVCSQYENLIDKLSGDGDQRDGDQRR